MKTLYLIILSSILLWSAPVMDESKALSLFAKIKKSEYNRVVSLWKQEIRLKSRARTSGRKSLWDDSETPIDPQDHSAYNSSKHKTDLPKPKPGQIGIP
jgi:hypothetical protein